MQRAGLEVLAATDIHETAAKTYKENIGSECVTKDIRDLSPNEFFERGNFEPDEVDLVVGGPPCKGFSTAGPFDVDDPRNDLFRQYLEIVEEIQPDAILMENVKGILSMHDGAFKQQILEHTDELGYNTDYMRLNAANYGVPQLRERVFFIGYQNGEKVSRPEQSHTGSKQKRVTEYDADSDFKPYVTTKSAVNDLAFLGVGEESLEYKRDPETDYQERMRGDQSELYNHKAPNHSERIQERFAKFRPGESVDDVESRIGADKIKTKKHTIQKWDPEAPTNTVTTLPEDFIHYEQNRIPTVRELARIQSFPDWFEFKGPRTTGGKRRSTALPQYSQVGNAVPPLLAEALGREIRVTLLGEKKVAQS
ncbi:DNA (cytosine-5)-methyltransferase 1 [Halorubrum xinjiangense]|uniref:DNA (cytosine-5-)-methyltransferase n=2 Tax=Halorubrum xinjiangense TaxID=261291 RepID=A0A1G7LX44_9EURY|nr:DNA (cytosine-5)-methyltransferase 1 [Halorubrum xinjiangense]